MAYAVAIVGVAWATVAALAVITTRRALEHIVIKLDGRAQARDELVLELAHKVSAPDQAAVDHVFEQARSQRAADGEEERRKRIASAAERRMRELGVDPDELAAPLEVPQ